MKRKKEVALLLLTAVLAAAGCADEKTTGENTTESGSAAAVSGSSVFDGKLEENVTIRVLENDTAISKGYFDELITAFNEAYADQGITAVDANMDQYLDLANDGPYGYGPDVLYQANDVIMQYDHEGRVFARTKNGTLALAADSAGLKVTADLGGTEIGRQLFAEIKGGYTDKMSFGFTVAEDKRETTRDLENNTVTVNRTITKIKKLYDVSAVSLPANDATSISARKFLDGEIERIKAERLQRADTATKIKLKLLGV